METSTFAKIFKAGSRTYFYSSLFFPKAVRDDVFILYSFVRTADDFVDSIPQQKKAFLRFVSQYHAALQGTQVDNEIITEYVDLMHRKQFDPQWVEAFLKAMQQDLTKSVYKSIKETEEYMHGSAEVIGLMMAAIMDLPKESYPAARKLGKAMQFINFIRDIQEDITLGRMYLPFNELTKLGLKELSYKDAQQNPEAFQDFIEHQLNRYMKWQKEAEMGFYFIPSRYRIPIKTASDMYKFTAFEIRKNPFMIYKKKIKPSVYQIIGNGIRNSVAAL